MKKYVIYQMNFAYDDEVYSKGNARTLGKIFDDKENAEIEWQKLERKSIKDMPLNGRDVFQDGCHESAEDNYQTLLKLLNKFGMPTTMINDKNIDKLTDEQLLEILLATESNNYFLAEYDENETVYTLYFIENGLVNEFQGYLVLYDDYAEGFENIIQMDSVDELLQPENFYVTEESPMASHFTEKDKNSPLIEALLEQYKDSFVVMDAVIYFLEEDNTEPLQAMNALLEHPFYEIRKHTPEQILTLQKDNSVRKTIDDNSLPSNNFQKYEVFMEEGFKQEMREMDGKYEWDDEDESKNNGSVKDGNDDEINEKPSFWKLIFKR